MLQFQLSSLIDAPVEVVWEFHERSDVLELLTPPWQPIKVVRREGGLEIGALTEFQIFLGPVPLRWVAEHTAYEKYRLFIDQQIEGPFQSWVHQHQFAAENGKTRLTDAIAFSMPVDWLAEPLVGWIVLAQLDSLFRYRHRLTQQQCAPVV
jgi:ligand-binding SRPBCC domain-containing protein